MIKKLLSLLKAVKPEKWKLKRGVVSLRAEGLTADVIKTLPPALSIDVAFSDNGVKRRLRVITQGKNDGTDKLFIDGVEQKSVDVDFDLIYKWFKLVAQIEFRYVNAHNEKHELVLYTSFGYGSNLGSLFG